MSQLKDWKMSIQQALLVSFLGARLDFKYQPVANSWREAVNLLEKLDVQFAQSVQWSGFNGLGLCGSGTFSMWVDPMLSCDEDGLIFDGLIRVCAYSKKSEKLYAMTSHMCAVGATDYVFPYEPDLQMMADVISHHVKGTPEPSGHWVEHWNLKRLYRGVENGSIIWA